MLRKSNIFYNKIINKKELKKLIEWAFNNYGQKTTVFVVDQLKELGFEYATKSGISISLEDLQVPPIKSKLMQETVDEVVETDFDFNSGQITEVEKFQKIIHLWDNTSQDLKERIVDYFEQTNPLNSVYIMAFSGARGNLSQVRQLIGMRGLMSDPSGQLIDLPICTNFREGLSTTDYIISSYGARKGLVDTAIRTADSGYLTRRLVEVAQCIIVSEVDCKTNRGIFLSKKTNKNEISLSFQQRVIGRVLARPIFNPETKKVIANRNEAITYSLVNELISLNIRGIEIRSPLTCECRRSVCQYCYGWNLACRDLVDLGESVGLIAAQSIGEPGTQLTMRTFHTGGVFESKRIVRSQSNFSGFLIFPPTLKKRPFRTKYGEDGFISENDSYLTLINFRNKIKSIRITKNTLIFGKENEYVKRGDVLFEPIQKKKYVEIADQETKYIKAKYGGEIITIINDYYQEITPSEFKLRNNIFWILSGRVHTIPLKSKIRARKLESILPNQSIAQSKFTSWFGGFIRIIKDEFTKQLNSIKIVNSYQSLDNLKLYIEKSNSRIDSCKLYISKQFDILINPYLSKRQQFIFGFLNNKKYSTKTGGLFYASNFWEFNFPHRRRPNYSKKVQSGLTVFHIPESFFANIEKTNNFILKKNLYILKNTKIFSNNITNIDGFINFSNKKTIKDIKITPARQYFLKNKKSDIRELDKQIYFPGEILFDVIDITELSYLEVQRTTKNGTYIYLRPIVRYELTKENPFKKFANKYFIDINLEVEDFILNPIFESDSKSMSAIQLLYSPLRLSYPFSNSNSEVKLEIRSSQNTNDKKKKNIWGKIDLGFSQSFSVDNLLPREMKKHEVIVDLIVEEKQFVEAYTSFALCNVLASFKNFVLDIKQQVGSQKRDILLITDADIKSIYLEDSSHQYKKNQLLKLGEGLGENLIIPESGIIKSIQGNKLIYHRIQPHLFTKGALVRKKLGDFVRIDEDLGQLVFEILKTGDIVQGLPKVEEVLEARKPKHEAVLATRPGILKTIIYENSKIFLEFIKPCSSISSLKRYEIPNQNKLIVQTYDFINIGDALTEGSLNPNIFLHIYFKYFCSLKLFSIHESAYKSLKKLQTSMLTAVQEIYFEEGVVISDKHVELIIKQMTDKVFIESAGNTTFLPGDIIDLEQAKYINLSLKRKKKLVFYPIVLGITKSALKTEGFLAAASFQETMRVLTQAALEGKTDWLRGLKENIITGRLIPAGTAFYEQNDITFNKIRLPKSPMKQKKYSNLSQQTRLKCNQLKPIVTFKQNS